jgi:hypothetical protein
MMTPERLLFFADNPRPSITGKITMAKKARKTSRPQSSTQQQDKNVPVTKQTAGGVAGAVLGGVVLGPIGAIAGGVTGAMVGDASAKGKKPIKKAAEAIRTEVTEGRVGDALKSVTARVKTKIQSLRKRKKAKKSATAKKSASKPARATKKSKSKPAKKAKTAKKKASSARKKMR